MDRDTFIITVYCLVVETFQSVKENYAIRRGGFPPGAFICNLNVTLSFPTIRPLNTIAVLTNQERVILIVGYPRPQILGKL